VPFTNRSLDPAYDKNNVIAVIIQTNRSKKARRRGKGKEKAGAEDAEDDWGD